MVVVVVVVVVVVILVVVVVVVVVWLPGIYVPLALPPLYFLHSSSGMTFTRILVAEVEG